MDQKRRTLLLTIGGGVLAGALIMALLYSPRHQPSAAAPGDGGLVTTAHTVGQAPNADNPEAVEAALAAGAARPAATTQEIAALNRMTGVLLKAATVNSPEELANLLQAEGQEPFIVRDGNSETGEMTIVRTKSPLEGTRYLHAQFFTQDDGSKMLQHVSFEFKPGANSRAEAISAVQRTFSGLGNPTVNDAGFIKWNLSNGYLVSVSVPTTQQLLENPFNAHTAEDAGTVVVTYEQEIHE